MSATVLQPVSEKILGIIKEVFPFDSIHNNQDKILWAMMQAYAQKKKFCVLELGTGTGKSVIGTVGGRIISDDLNKLRAQRCLQHGLTYSPHSPTVITKTRVLQKQYEDSFRNTRMGVGILWGKGHYSDLNGPNAKEDAEIHKCGPRCPGMSYSHSPLECPYLLALRDYMNPSNVGVTNNAMYLSAPFFRAGTNVLVVDECHKLADDLTERSTMELSSRRLLQIMRKYEIPETDYMEACVTYEKDVLKEGRINLRTILDHINNVSGFAETSIIPHIVQHRESIISNAPSYTQKVDKLVKQCDRAISSVENLIKRIELILNSSDAKEVTWICWKDVEKEKDENSGEEYETTTIKVKPLSPLKWTVEDMMDGLGFTIFMSATVGDYNHFCKELHLDPKDGEFICIPTPFPVENRQVFDMALGGMNYNNRLELLGEEGDFTRAIHRIARKHPDTRGLIHTVSYANAKIIKDRLQGLGRQIIIPPSGTVIDRNYLGQFGSDCIICSPSMAEGVDLKDDLCRWQVILKVPYPSLGNLWIKAKLNSDEQWYSNCAMMDILQMSGRGVRHEEDYCTTYILDSNVRRLKFPDWFTEAVVTI